MHRISGLLALLGLMLVAPAAQAQGFTTAAEVKPILQATRANWIAVREYGGDDLLYFTNALAWRCGLVALRYGLNGAAATTDLPMEPCHDTEAAPNALKLDSGAPIYLTLPLGSVTSVTVLLVFDDGSEESASFARAAVLTP